VKAAVLALAALVATGCMGRSVSEGTGKPDPAIPAKTYLRITVWPKGDSGAQHRYSLWCRGPGGETSSGIARPITGSRACQRVVNLGPKAFEPVPRDVACTEVYGGPAVAKVTGLIGGDSVTARFRRTDGCEIARWDRLGFLLPGA
jgi:hypothetical protein